MSRLQIVLLLVLVALSSFVVGQEMWGVLAPAAGSGASAGLGLLASVPEWAWHTLGWTVLSVVFSTVWWLPCALGTGSCSSRACAPATA